MIRLVATASLTTMLLLVLYLPSAHSPERFAQQIRNEHFGNIQFWGQAHADRILNRMLDLQAEAQTVSPVPRLANVPREAAHHAAGREMLKVNERLLNSAYFRSVDALFTLALFRVSMLIEWLPKIWILAISLPIDAFLLRIIKSKKFLHHDPELFAFHASTAIIVLCSTAMALIVPWRIHPATWSAIPLTLCVLIHQTIANFHRRP